MGKTFSSPVRVSERTARKWLRRFKEDGVAGLQDRSSRPHRSPAQTPAEPQRQVEQFRRQRFTGAQIAQETGLSRATVFRILGRLGLNRLASLEPAAPAQR